MTRRGLCVAVCLAAAIVWIDACKPKPMTPQEYYRYLMKENGHPIVDEADPRITDAELQKATRAVRAGEMLMPLLDDLQSNLPAQHQAMRLDVYVGMFPLRNMNARTLRAPNGGILILVNQGLTKALHEWAKLLVDVVVRRANEASAAETLHRFRESMRAYADSQTIPAFPEYSNAETEPLALAIGASAAQFVVAHEYAHALLGHVDSTPLGSPRFTGDEEPADYDDREAKADALAADLLLHDRNRGPEGTRSFPIEVQIAGVYYNLTVFELIELLEGSRRDSNYPNMVMRLGGMHTRLRRELNVDQYTFPNEVGAALELVANAVISENRPDEELSPDHVRIRNLYRAFKAGNRNEMRSLVAQNRELFAGWVAALIELAMIFAEGVFRANASWSDGDFLNAADLFSVSVAVNDVWRTEFGKDAIDGIDAKGVAIVRALRDSAAQFEAKGITNVTRDKLRQSESVTASLRKRHDAPH